MTGRPPVLSVRGLSVRFLMPGGRRVAAVTDARFDVAAGECVALIGESGCGKSVLASALLGLLPANAQTAGEARLGDLALLTADERTLARTVRGRRIGLVPQSPAAHLTPVRTIRSQLEETVRALTGVRGRSAVRAAAEAAAERTAFPWTTSTATRTNCPADWPNAPRPLSPWSATRLSCSPTNPPPGSTATWWSTRSTNCDATSTTATGAC